MFSQSSSFRFRDLLVFDYNFFNFLSITSFLFELLVLDEAALKPAARRDSRR